MYKSVFLVLSAVASVAFAQLPTCANDCIKLPAACPNPLPSCICKQSDWINSVACCVFSTCTSDSDRTEVINYANSICNPEGVTLPTSPSNCPANETVSSISSSVAASSSASGSTTASGSSSALSSALASVSSVTSRVSSSASAAAASASSSALGARAVGAGESVGFVGAMLGLFALL